MTDLLSDELLAIRALQHDLKTRLDEEQDTFAGLAKRLWAQQEAEKARLSRDLHDGVGQLLTGLTRRLQAVSEQDPELAELHQLAEMALADVRQMSRLMSPTILDDLGLKPALKWLCRSLLAAEPLEYQCDIHLPENLDRQVSVVLFRIAQESLVNAVKHARASRIDVSVLTHHNVVRMQISDNGCGFEQAKIEPGVGLMSLADRAKAFAATVQIDTAPDQGTRVIVSVPL